MEHGADAIKFACCRLRSEVRPTRVEQADRRNPKFHLLLTRSQKIWFLVSFVFGILLVDELNSIKFGGFKLGFWFAQQGSIYSFLVLIFWYGAKMNKLDKKYKVEE